MCVQAEWTYHTTSQRGAVFFLIQIGSCDEDDAPWRRIIFLSDVVVLPHTEKVLRNLFASAEEVPHVLLSFFHLRFTSGRQVRTKGHLFKTRVNALHHVFFAPDVQFNVHFARHVD